MSRYMTILTYICITLLFLFIKLYRHNVLIQLTYDYQHLEHKKEVMKKQYYTTLAQLSCYTNLEACARYAEHDLGMERLKFAHIRSIEHHKGS